MYPVMFDTSARIDLMFLLELEGAVYFSEFGPSFVHEVFCA